MADDTGYRAGGSTLQAVDSATLTGYGSNNTLVFDNNSTATTTIELRKGMKQDGGDWVHDEDDENNNNTLDFSAVQGDVTVTVGDQNSYQISYATVAISGSGTDTVENWTQHTVTVKFMSSDGNQQLDRKSTRLNSSH